jgi:IS5 family transposase
MILKFRRTWSYEELLVHVNESVFLRRFCGFSLSDELPDDTTLIKLTGRLGEDFVRTLNRAVVLEAKKRRLVKGRKMRLDTTAVNANIRYPTDSGLVYDGIRVIERLVQKIKARGVLKGMRIRRFAQLAKILVSRLGRRLKGRASVKAAAQRATRKLLTIAWHVQRQARKVHRHLDRSKEEALRRLSEAVALYLGRLQRVMDQARLRLQGQVSIPGLLVSLFDPDVRPIDRGKIFPRVEFGFKALFQEAENSIVTAYEAVIGAQSDIRFLPGALQAHRDIFGQLPQALAADRGFDDRATRKRLLRLIRHVSIPARGYNKDPAQVRRQSTSWFRRLQRWRAGGEAKGSLLKRCFGWSRALMKGRQGAEIWIGHGTLAHNLWQMARLLNSS